MKSFTFFKARLRHSWKAQYEMVQIIADWTVLLYIILPAAVIGSFLYHSLWIHVASSIHTIPLAFYFVVGVIVNHTGSYRTFTQEADVVFLLKHKKLLYALKKWGYIYSVCIHVMKNLIFTFLLLPIYVQCLNFP